MAFIYSSSPIGIESTIFIAINDQKEDQQQEPLFGVQQTYRLAGLKHPPRWLLHFNRGEPLARRIRCNKRPARQRGLQDDVGGSVGSTAGSFGGMKSDSFHFSPTNAQFIPLTYSASPISIPLVATLPSLSFLHLLFPDISTSPLHPLSVQSFSRSPLHALLCYSFFSILCTSSSHFLFLS